MRTKILLFVLSLSIPARLFIYLHQEPKPRGIPVVLVHACSTIELAQLGDGHDEFIRYFSGNRAFVNETPIPPIAIPNIISHIMSTRAERAVWVAAGSPISFGGLAQDIASLRQRTPLLAILLTTTSQTGPIDPEALAELPPDHRIIMQCLPRFVDAAEATSN
jgi:hypothetical protein